MSDSLPPGQRSTADFPRFGLTQFAGRFPSQTSRVHLEVVGCVENELQLTDALHGLPRFEQVSDFHCVTTWSRRSLRWSGIRFVDFYNAIVLPKARPFSNATLVALRGQDGARTAMLLSDLLGEDVMLADTLEGKPLTVEHGAPVRLVAPAHYGYKSIKYLTRLEFKSAGSSYAVSALRFMDHPRARVALEERGRWAPGWLLRYLYRPLVPATITRFDNALTQYQTNEQTAAHDRVKKRGA
jgi:DMSO/TMAO reductase YedYZ molybdopterin-dependent catalytic subunit